MVQVGDDSSHSTVGAIGVLPFGSRSVAMNSCKMIVAALFALCVGLSEGGESPTIHMITFFFTLS